jgi:hypothetical protein
VASSLPEPPHPARTIVDASAAAANENKRCLAPRRAMISSFHSVLPHCLVFDETRSCCAFRTNRSNAYPLLLCWNAEFKISRQSFYVKRLTAFRAASPFICLDTL